MKTKNWKEYKKHKPSEIYTVYEGSVLGKSKLRMIGMSNGNKVRWVLNKYVIKYKDDFVKPVTLSITSQNTSHIYVFKSIWNQEKDEPDTKFLYKIDKRLVEKENPGRIKNLTVRNSRGIPKDFPIFKENPGVV